MAQQQLINDRYQVMGHLGEGGMAMVYHGLDRVTENPVAIKMLKPSVIQDNPLILERFRREVEALSQLEHPHIVRVLDFISRGSQHIIVMEYMAGGALRHWLKKHKRLPLEQAVNIALDLSDALARAHRLKIIHRDVKPDNVLLTASGIPRLTDFGTAHMTDLKTITAAGSFIGTVQYMAPECLKGDAADARSDMWSFGIMVYEMLTGYRPFMGKNFSQIVMAIFNQPVPDLRKLRQDAPPELAKLVHTMLEKEPEQRPGSMRQAGAILEEVLDNL